MLLLLDTHLLLWAAGDPDRLSAQARELISDPDNQLNFSIVSLWELSIKRSLGRTELMVDPAVLRRGLLDNDYRELAITGAHALAVEHLPPIHKDPFDRLLVAQASHEGMILLTSDDTLTRYPGTIRKV